jgi:hypothetical protein
MRVRWGRVVVVLALVALLACGLGVLMLSALAPSRGGGGSFTSFAPPPVESPAAPMERSTARPAVAGGNAYPGGAAPSGEGLPPFKVLTLQYAPYMATLALMDARGYMEKQGYDLQLVDAYSDAVKLDEEGQCKAVQSGEYAALATTVDATRKCGEGVVIGVPVGQSAGNDAIVVKPGVASWNDVFEHAIAFTGYSVSEYMACFASHTANQPMKLPLRYDDAAQAVDEWRQTGAEQDILSVVAWQPEVDRALAAVPGSRVILSSKDMRLLWDVIEFSRARVQDDPAAFAAFTRAYYQALLDLSRNPADALNAIVAWAGEDPGRQALLTTTDPDEFKKQLDNEAFATLRDAAILMEQKQTLLNRLDEAAFYWRYCNVAVPDVPDETALVQPDLVLQARQDAALVGNPEERPSSQVFQVTDFTDRAAVTDQQIRDAQVLFQSGVDIEFMSNRTDFKDPTAAATVLANAVRFLRICQDCVLEIQGGAAYPGERVCRSCKKEDSDALAIERGRTVYEELRQRFDVPEAQLRFVETPHSPQYPGSNDPEELRKDRRTFLTGYQLGGR